MTFKVCECELFWCVWTSQLTISIVTPITHSEETDRLTGDTNVDETKGQGSEAEGGDSRMLPQSLSNQTYGNTLTMPVVIPMQGNDNRNNLITTQLPGIVSPTVPNPYYPNQMIGTYNFNGNNAMAFSGDLSSGTGTISLAPVNPVQSMGQVVSVRVAQCQGPSVPLSASISAYAGADMRIQGMDQDNVFL